MQKKSPISKRNSESLTDLESIIDIALSHLSLEDLLTELTTRIQKALDLDSIAIVLIHNDELILKSSIGLKGLKPGTKISFTQGITGQVIKKMKPVFIEDVPNNKLIMPLLRKRKITSVVGAPMIAEGKLIGVMNGGTLKRRKFTEDEIRLLQLAADRVASAIDRVQLHEAERAAHIKLQATADKLTTSNHLVNSILESISDGFISLNSNQEFIYVNKQAEILLDKKKHELIGQKATKVFSKQWDSSFSKKQQEAFTNRDQTTIEEFLPSINRWLEIRTYPSKEGLSIYFTDITERKNLEQKKDEFISIASHELKTPLTSLKGYTQILQVLTKELGNQNLNNYLTKMDNQLDKLATLVNDLFDVSKIHAGKLELRKEKFDISKLIEETIEDLQQTTETHQIKFINNASVKIKADRYRMTQVLTNLISNAIKYSPEADKVIVKLANSDNEVTVSVQDFGIGIPKKYKNQIFDRFFRAENAQASDYAGGLGLGLFISSEIIIRHNGVISVKSVEGKGSTFSFTIPIK